MGELRAFLAVVVGALSIGFGVPTARAMTLTLELAPLERAYNGDFRSAECAF